MALAPIVAAVGGVLINVAGTVAGRVLVALGISVATFTGIDFTLDYLKDQALASITGMGATLVQLIAYLQVGTCINIIVSAMLARAALQGLTGGTFKRWVLS